MNKEARRAYWITQSGVRGDCEWPGVLTVHLGPHRALHHQASCVVTQQHSPPAAVGPSLGFRLPPVGLGSAEAAGPCCQVPER